MTTYRSGIEVRELLSRSRCQHHATLEGSTAFSIYWLVGATEKVSMIALFPSLNTYFDSALLFITHTSVPVYPNVKQLHRQIFH